MSSRDLLVGLSGILFFHDLVAGPSEILSSRNLIAGSRHVWLDFMIS